VNGRAPTFLLTLLLLAGCNSAIREKRTELQPAVSAGAIVEVHQSLEVRARYRRRFLQHGEAIKKQDRDRFEASCSFEVRQLKPEVQLIQPDRFVVTGIERGYQDVVQTRPVKLAGAIPKGGPIVARLYHYRLSSSQQPHVMRLTCYGGEALLHEAQYPSQSEIQTTLGEFATIH